MKLTPVRVFKQQRYSIERDDDTGIYYMSFPVFNGMVEYEEYYEIMPSELDDIMNDEKVRMQFLEKSRNHQNDDRILFKPGRLRGDPC